MVDPATVLEASFILSDRGLFEESMILEEIMKYGDLELNEVNSDYVYLV